MSPWVRPCAAVRGFCCAGSLVEFASLAGARAGEAAQLEGEEALARLHRQVLPLCLRRTKESVLTELPPKVIEDP